MSSPVAPKVERGDLTPVDKSLVEFGKDKGFKDGPFHGMDKNILGFPDPEQITEETGIQKIQLGTFYKSLGKIGMVGRKEMDDKTGRQYRDPFPSSGMRDAAIGGQRRKVQQLPAPAGAESDKSLKGLQVTYIGHLTDISVNIRPVISGQPILGLQTFVVNSRIKTLIEDFLKGERRFFSFLGRSD